MGPHEWEVEDVTAFLCDINLSEYCAAVEANIIDGAVMLELIACDGLAELGIVSKIHQSRIKVHIKTPSISKIAAGTRTDRPAPAAAKWDEAWSQGTKVSLSSRAQATRRHLGHK